MTGTISAPLYLLRGLQLIGWRDTQHALDYLYTDGAPREGMLVAINAEKMLAIEDNPEARALIEAAEFKYADSINVVRLLRKKCPQIWVSCVAGADLQEALMQRADAEGTPVFLVGGKYEVLTQTESGLCQRWQVNIVGSQDGHFTPEQHRALFERIRDSGAKIVIIATGLSYQEILIRDRRCLYPHVLYMDVGSTYDVFTGYVHQASKFWQDLRLEQFYRLLLQSSRIRRQFRLLHYLRWHCTGKL